jgi:predicted metal-dependent phosphoesterase TrpH
MRLVGDATWPVDLHCHTAGRSWDSTLDLGTLVADASRRGVRAACLTEHDAFWQAVDLEPGECVLIPGTEINTDDGHVLVFGLEEYRFGFHHSRVLAAAVEAAGGAMVLAHPFRRALPEVVEPNTSDYERALARALDNPLLRAIAAVEVANGRATEAQNRFSADLARCAGLPGVAGSDAHRPGEAGRVATLFESPVRSCGDLVEALAARRFRPGDPAAARYSASAGQPGHQQLQR